MFTSKYLTLSKTEISRAKKAYKAHKGNAYYRGIGWEFTFEEWFEFWLDSGHWFERGHKKGQYVMGRFNDIGPYSVNNVKIITHSQNVIEGHTGAKRSKETKRKISEAHKGRTYKPHTDEWKEKMRQSKLGKKRPNITGGKNVRAKRVVVEGKEYAAISDAARQLGIHSETIRTRLKSKNFSDYYYL